MVTDTSLYCASPQLTAQIRREEQGHPAVARAATRIPGASLHVHPASLGCGGGCYRCWPGRRPPCPHGMRSQPLLTRKDAGLTYEGLDSVHTWPFHQICDVDIPAARRDALVSMQQSVVVYFRNFSVVELSVPSSELAVLLFESISRKTESVSPEASLARVRSRCRMWAPSRWLGETRCEPCVRAYMQSVLARCA